MSDSETVPAPPAATVLYEAGSFWTAGGGPGPLVMLAIALTVIAIIWLLWYGLSKKTTVVHFASSNGALATDLHEAGWKLYTRPGCSWCEKQKRTVTMPAPALVDCAGGAHPRCAQIRGFPHWHNEKTGAAVEGYQTSEELSRLL